MFGRWHDRAWQLGTLRSPRYTEGHLAREGAASRRRLGQSCVAQDKFGCDKVTLQADYCRNALQLDAHNIEANLLLGEGPGDENAEQMRVHLETVLAYAKPESLEYAQARKLLARESWTFTELCERIGSDGVLR